MASTVCSLTDNPARTSLTELFVVLLVTLESCAFKVSPSDEKKLSPSAPKPSPSPAPPASMAKVPPPAFVEKVAPPAAVQKVAPPAPIEKVTPPAGSVFTSFFVCLLCFS